MIHFASAQYLLLIFVIPFFFIFYALYRRGRRRKIEALGDVKLLEKLMPASSKVRAGCAFRSSRQHGSSL